jgi:hypothetical protein
VYTGDKPQTSVAEPHHFYAAPAPDTNFDAVPAAPAPASTFLYSKAKFILYHFSIPNYV